MMDAQLGNPVVLHRNTCYYHQMSARRAWRTVGIQCTAGKTYSHRCHTRATLLDVLNQIFDRGPAMALPHDTIFLAELYEPCMNPSTRTEGAKFDTSLYQATQTGNGAGLFCPGQRTDNHSQTGNTTCT